MPAGRWKTEAITLMDLWKNAESRINPSQVQQPVKQANKVNIKRELKTKNKTNKDLVKTHKLNTYQEKNKEQIQKNKTHEYLTFKIKQEVT